MTENNEKSIPFRGLPACNIQFGTTIGRGKGSQIRKVKDFIQTYIMLIYGMVNLILLSSLFSILLTIVLIVSQAVLCIFYLVVIENNTALTKSTHKMIERWGKTPISRFYFMCAIPMVISPILMIVTIPIR